MKPSLLIVLSLLFLLAAVRLTQNRPDPAPPHNVAVQPLPTTAPLDSAAFLAAGIPVEVIACGSDPTWALPSREAQQREVWDEVLRGADERRRMEVQSSYPQPLIYSDGAWLFSGLDEGMFNRIVREYGLWNATAEAWRCRTELPPTVPRAVEVVMKGYRVGAVRRVGSEVLIWGEPASGIEWLRVELPAEWGHLMVHVALSDGAYGLSQLVPAP